MKKGIIMEINDEFLTLLTPEGQFLHAKKQENCIVGEEIVFRPMIKRPIFNRLLGIKQLSAAAAVMLILLASLIPMYQNNKAYAYMSVNSSIELGVNKNMKVVKITPFNSEGKKIISHIGSWKTEDISTVAGTIIDEMKKQGYLKKNTSVVISTVQIEHPEEKAEKQLIKNLDEIKKIAKENNLDPIVINKTEQDFDKARSQGITAEKYTEEISRPVNKKDNQQPAANQKAVAEKQAGSNFNAQTSKSSNHAAVKKGSNHKNVSSEENKNHHSNNMRKKAEVQTKYQHYEKAWPETNTTNKGKDEKKNIHNNGEMKKQENTNENSHHDK